MTGHVNVQMRRMQKELTMAYFRILSWHLTETTKIWVRIGVFWAETGTQEC
jgi:hypothetical protein